ncbi:NAD(P)-binding protein [Sulfitobacter sp. D35]|uniref:FAD-dependent oxidoreductase n=1 Tax=Sulfitobacter sp. D35 TaxID=3083252 RepID=UPI00296EA9FC|nr:FAD-dependent oxidoreductase [Sulfitobacter sp. D35]MDW4497400.1 NAD(P)-binding protein [Sulfitobacter sp. D35]
MTNHYSDFSEDNPADLVIVGAGAAGLSALSVATEYLPRNARIVLIERRERCGGMWNSVYDHVRLHQPHGSFTAGNIAWDWSKPRGYLARKPEVLAHLGRCYDTFRTRVGLIELFGHEMTGWQEAQTDAGSRVEVTCRAAGTGAAEVRIHAKRLIRAPGYDVAALEPLTLSSKAVVSTTPEKLAGVAAKDGTAPICIVGGGKTGMDTALSVIRRDPDRRVTLLTGQGTIFADREKMFPPGAGRWWRGQLVLSLFGDIAMRFDGDNEAEVFEHFRDTYAVSPDGRGERFLYALMSKSESDEIAAGAVEILPCYLQDVVDTASGPELRLRSGNARDVEPGTIFVNCTGHVLHSGRSYEPYVSSGGAVMTVTPRSCINFQSILSSYFLTHLMFMDRLREVPLYEMDFEALYPKGAKIFQMASMTHSWMNIVMLIGEMPLRVLNGFGADLDRWFPLHRRTAGLIDVKMNRGRYLAHGRAALDRVHARFGIPCGPIVSGGEVRTADLVAP